MIASKTRIYPAHFRPIACTRECLILPWVTSGYRNVPIWHRTHGVGKDTRLARRSAADRPAQAAQRSRVANGSALLPGVDGRSAWVRRCKELIADHLADLGGEDNCSAAERSIIRPNWKDWRSSSR
jgi:hypothetical protein